MDAAQNPLCAQETLDLLNCTTEKPYDKEKCQRLLESLRQCVLNKKIKKFLLAEVIFGNTEGTTEKRS
uniref:Uncharacterized protein LOC104236702 n=1 Tax=Nicotiana sylvestris TaxID=4096 RepID=A0A1U7XPY7_NICSY|nr:PREDICTED: uncharacterized protein LOC104236702 [Nicotiana sylvestris]